MVYSSDKESSDCEEMSNQIKTPERLSSDGSNVRTCVDCGTCKTPLWRGGPAGPKSLCNACGIRSRKKRRALLGVTKEEKKTKKSSIGKVSYNSSDGSTSSSEGCTSKNDDFELENRRNKVWEFGKQFVYQKPRSVNNNNNNNNNNRRRKMGDVEQAAILLMALSCGSVYA